MKIDVPPQLYGGNPAGLLEHFGLQVDSGPSKSGAEWEISLGPINLIKAQTLLGQ